MKLLNSKAKTRRVCGCECTRRDLSLHLFSLLLDLLHHEETRV